MSRWNIIVQLSVIWNKKLLTVSSRLYNLIVNFSDKDSLTLKIDDQNVSHS